MNNRIHTTIILAAAAFAACSGSERADIAPVTETSRIMLVREGAADVSVYAFRREGAVFLFDTLFREGWTPDGKLSVRLPNGHYKFLFASGRPTGSPCNRPVNAANFMGRGGLRLA